MRPKRLDFKVEVFGSNRLQVSTLFVLTVGASEWYCMEFLQCVNTATTWCAVDITHITYLVILISLHLSDTWQVHIVNGYHV